MRARPLLTAALALTLVLVACGDDDDSSDGTTASDVDGNGGDATDAPDDATDDDADQPAAQGGGSATITVDGETWEFASVQSAFGEEETGQEGAELVVSAIGGGLQFYVSIDRFGNSISIDDIEDFENPSVSWSAAEIVPGDEVTIDVDGKAVSGGSDAFRDGTDDESLDAFDGTFEATCP